MAMQAIEIFAKARAGCKPARPQPPRRGADYLTRLYRAPISCTTWVVAPLGTLEKLLEVGILFQRDTLEN